MFDRLERLIGKNNLNKLANIKVLLVGVGGVGGFALESLIRSGIVNITIVDGDVFEDSNLNRQIISNQENIGKNKAEEAKKRCLLINPKVKISAINNYITKDNLDSIGSFDYIIDACDDVNAKIELIKYSFKTNTKIICSMGTGKRLNPSLVQISRLDKTYNDPLAKIMRNKLKKEGISLKIPVVFSTELPLNSDNIISSNILVPGVAGINLAFYIINDCLKNS